MNNKQKFIVASTHIVLGTSLVASVLLNKQLLSDTRTLERQLEGAKEERVALLDENFNLKNELEKAVSELSVAREQNDILQAEIQELEGQLTTKLNGKSYIQKRKLDITATAYTQSDEEGTADGITKTGTRATEGRTIAVDPNVIPLGSLVYIKSPSPYVGGFYVAEDIGGAIKGNKIDIFMNSKTQAFAFGRQQVELIVLEEIN